MTDASPNEGWAGANADPEKYNALRRTNGIAEDEVDIGVLVRLVAKYLNCPTERRSRRFNRRHLFYLRGSKDTPKRSAAETGICKESGSAC